MKKGAVFSYDRKYRYALWRDWNDELFESGEKSEVLFIGLNPSTANEYRTDPTITRVVRFARRWGYGGVVMMNLFGIVSSSPEILTKHPDPVGKENDTWLRYYSARKCDVIFAWGAFKQVKDRANQVIKMFDNPMCLGTNQDGSPKHPLYLPADSEPIPYQPLN